MYGFMSMPLDVPISVFEASFTLNVAPRSPAYVTVIFGNASSLLALHTCGLFAPIPVPSGARTCVTTNVSVFTFSHVISWAVPEPHTSSVVTVRFVGVVPVFVSS